MNRDFAGPTDERPPLVVVIHGGPTGATHSVLNLGIQFWTSRGFAVVDVDYGGSTGYGRAYRERLRDRWGIVDVDDCVNAARGGLPTRARSTRSRMVIRGGSAGGYTTLAALAFRDVFAAGASYFGVADAEALAARHAQVRVPLSRRPHRPVAGGRRSSTSSDRRSTTPTA